MPVSADLRGAVAQLRNDPDVARVMGNRRQAAGVHSGQRRESKGRVQSRHNSPSGLAGAGFVAVQGAEEAARLDATREFGSKRTNSSGSVRQRTGESGLWGAGLAAVSVPDEKHSTRRAVASARKPPTRGAYPGAADQPPRAEKAQAAQSSARRARELAGDSCHAVLLQENAPAPALLAYTGLAKPADAGSRTEPRPHKTGKASLGAELRVKSSTTRMSERGFGSIPVEKADTAKPPSGKRSISGPTTTPDILTRDPLPQKSQRVVPTRRLDGADGNATGRRRTASTDKDHGSLITGHAMFLTPERVRRDALSQPRDSLATALGLVGDRSEPMTSKWKESPVQIPVKPRAPERRPIHQKPSLEASEVKRGRRSTMPSPPPNRTHSGLCRSATPPFRAYSIIAPTVPKDETRKMSRQPTWSAQHDHLGSCAKMGTGNWAAPEPRALGRRSISAEHFPPQPKPRATMKGLASFHHRSSGNILVW
ncbi:hypothetical protein DIPPA_28158 [Diplonema papillatum]|nr:hypothetical protein DIPPA_28158 [Diplonema papillatum]